ncbi:PKD domain-containing protein [Cellulomonas sp. URHB0016]
MRRAVVVLAVSAATVLAMTAPGAASSTARAPSPSAASASATSGAQETHSTIEYLGDEGEASSTEPQLRAAQEDDVSAADAQERLRVTQNGTRARPPVPEGTELPPEDADPPEDTDPPQDTDPPEDTDPPQDDPQVDAVPEGRLAPGSDGATAQGLTPQALAPLQQVNITDCQDEDFARGSGGFVVSHYYWCQTGRFRAKTEVCTRIGPFRCVYRRVIGTATFRMTTIGYGWDGSMPRIDDEYVDASYNQMRFVTLLDEFTTTGVGPAMVLRVGMQCEAQTDGALCLQHPFDHGQTKTVAQWMLDGGTFIRFLHDPTEGQGRDTLAYFEFDTELAVEGPDGDSVTIGGNEWRCDSATYLVGRRGCMFNRVTEQIPVSTDNPEYPEAAAHVYDAQFRPELTLPPLDGKSMPGSPFAPNTSPLHRLYPGYEGTIYRANRETARGTCRLYWGTNYADGGNDCDEYPLASTYQGAATANGNYSARVIPGWDNQELGRRIGNWYGTQRILHDDPYYVIVVRGDDGYTGSGGGQGAGGIVPAHHTSVNAGPDVTGDEGSPVTLHGSVHSLSEGGAAARWTYSTVEADAGTSCSFGNAARAATSFTCDDDGVFTVTLTADSPDGAVSDSAQVTLRNVPPKIELTGPAPWTLFRAGTPVDLTATVSDAGNDPLTCSVSWDDGSTDGYPASGGTCDRRHVFTAPGMYTIEATVADDDGGSAKDETMVIVYDPDAGWTNLDGSSALGGSTAPGGAAPAKAPAAASAVAAQSAATGPSWHHLTGRYYNGSATPTGRAALWVPATSFRLEARDLEWLVVTPDGKTVAKGTGSVDNKPGYGFVVYGYQGCAQSPPPCQPGTSKVRTLVWPLAEGLTPGTGTLFDNSPDADFDVDIADPRTMSEGQVLISRP